MLAAKREFLIPAAAHEAIAAWGGPLDRPKEIPATGRDRAGRWRMLQVDSCIDVSGV